VTWFLGTNAFLSVSLSSTLCRISVRAVFVLLLASAAACGQPAAPDDATATIDVCSGGWFRCYARARVVALATPSGYGPAELESAYNLDVSTPVDATVAVVDAFGYPGLETDLASYRSQFGLPACTSASGCLTIVNQEGQTAPLPQAPPPGDDWTIETALDVDMASAGCPSCKLIVVQADDDGGDGLVVGNDIAAAAGATVISNSWGASEAEFDVSANDMHFTHAGIATFASTGDGGFEPDGASYPASSSNVIAVGGTSLERDAVTARGYSERAWAGAGAGCSVVVPKPSWQTSRACDMRMIGDVSAVANPGTGVAVAHGGGWTVVGGTSASSPLVAAIFAQTGHGAATPAFAYANPTAFFDVTTGSDGACDSVLCSAAPGWDGPTGNGAPNGAVLTGALAPTLAVVQPFDGQVVPPGFTVQADCTSNDGASVAEVDFTVGVEPLGDVTVPPYTIAAPTSLPDRSYTIAIACSTSSGAQTTRAVSVTQAPGCSADADCPGATDTCYLGACIAGNAGADGLGASCRDNSDCDSGQCASDGIANHCVIPCALGTDACPTGFSCEQAGAGGACWPLNADAGTGGCDASGRASPWLVAMALALASRLRRRRRAR
jgi:hypothetical protein